MDCAIQMNILSAVQTTAMIPRVVIQFAQTLKIHCFVQAIALKPATASVAIIFAITTKIVCLVQAIAHLSPVEMEFAKKTSKLEHVQAIVRSASVETVFANSMKVQ